MIKVNILKKRIAYLGLLLIAFSGVISCEEDFTDIGSSIISNTKFNTNDTVLEVEITPINIESVIADGLGLSTGILDEYLLGVYNNTTSNYKKIEASIVSQLRISTDFSLIQSTYDTDTLEVYTHLDSVILKIPYQATLVDDATTAEYALDSVIGQTDTPFTFNLYEISTYLNTLNPEDPTQISSYLSDATYTTTGEALNETLNYQFIPNPSDTVFFLNRKVKPEAVFDGVTVLDSIIVDTIVLASKVPFARIPLKKEIFQEKFIDLYDAAEFDSQDAFNDYFRGVLLEATGDNGAIIPLQFSGTENPAIEIYYTNTVTSIATGNVKDVVNGNHSFSLGGVTNSIYKMTGTTTTDAGKFVLQGTAGAMANIKIFKDGLTDLQSKNWLINDASLTLYIDQASVGYDTINTPSRLFLYKNELDETTNEPINPSQIKDILSEGEASFGGYRELSDDRQPDLYNFRITDYVSDLLSGDSNYSPELGVKVYNSSDSPSGLVSDTVVAKYNWNPRMVTLLDHSEENDTRKARLKITYSTEKE